MIADFNTMLACVNEVKLGMKRQARRASRIANYKIIRVAKALKASGVPEEGCSEYAAHVARAYQMEGAAADEHPTGTHPVYVKGDVGIPDVVTYALTWCEVFESKLKDEAMALSSVMKADSIMKPITVEMPKEPLPTVNSVRLYKPLSDAVRRPWMVSSDSLRVPWGALQVPDDGPSMGYRFNGRSLFGL